MLKINLEKSILLKNEDNFKSGIKQARLPLIIKILPFLCACGSLIMLKMIEQKINSNINNLPNYDRYIRMSFLGENTELINYFFDKKIINEPEMIKYYVCSGGSNSNIYDLFTEKSWTNINKMDVINGIKNGNINTIKFFNNKNLIPIIDYSFLNNEKQRELIKNNNIFNYYLNNGVNDTLILEELYNRKQRNMRIFFSYIKIFLFFRKKQII